ncbi:MAG: hypothetical protein GY701_28810 [Sulfitobacter sp.]|nr:hypothetical protein [Sulfitobacter sp.]
MGYNHPFQSYGITHVRYTITGATNATPIVVTAAKHGLANGDMVRIEGVVGNTAANSETSGLFIVANVAADTFELTTHAAGANVAGNGAYVSGGIAYQLSGHNQRWSAADTVESEIFLPDVSVLGTGRVMIQADNDPAGANQDFDLDLMGRPDSGSDWQVLQAFTKATGTWGDNGEGDWALTAAVAVVMAPEMKWRLTAVASALNNVEAWLLWP